MSIRLLAKELYQSAKLVEKLEQALQNPGLKGAERQRIEAELRGARADLDRLRAILDGAKEG
ncbi:MAG TPA: hypothetical protein DCZ69_19740 [Syntrophobacteraceae bacterium]|jgi:hypothetical protein|nr:hypothetical protein [Syntrophobacteraceae bacterium]HBD10488.1 hypothetical protein [Syntrophobacteraceae bacterium]HBZ56665.1 hypothetical protein [Syntrophobacteraceae bacterium]